ncbi:superoxide dismutase family protein [Denitrobaculum tricleocarpae]|uniref:superoxide dismutase family protein n=1 Tax=Denitrobaculum tricleocarpae TaxID=2591009 RepID=UPI0015D2B477|nr:superoxide dismutase family protein [Denitrobaculum tricleocarpae]
MKRSLLKGAAFAVSVTLAGAAQAADHGSHTASAKIIGLENTEIGFANFEQGPHGVMIHIRVTGLEPGKKGVHLHNHGLCEHQEGFTTARGHIGLKEGGHGLMNPDGPEEGDLPNIFVGADGIGEAEMFTTMVNIGGGGVGDLLDADGSTLMIHANADDHVSQPIGGSGPRVACGVIEKE